MNSSERAVLGAALIAPDKSLETGLAAADFSDPMGASIWQAVVNRAASGEAVDVVTLVADLGEEYRSVVSRVMGESFSAANIRGYANLVRKEAKRRHLRGFIDGLNLDGDPDQVIEQALSGLIEMGRSRAVKAHSMKELMASLTDEIDAAKERRDSGGSVGVPTGLGRVDRLLGGMHRSDLLVVAARPSMGKTAWMLSVAMNAARRGYHGGIVSAEMAALQLGERAVSGAAKVPTFKMRNGLMQESDYTAVTEAMADLASLPIQITDPDVCRVSDVLMQAHVWAAKRLDFLMVDFLQLLSPDARQNLNRTREVGDMARSLKAVAKALNIPVVVLCQLNRGLESRLDKRPMMSDLRDSGEIEEAADEILFLYRDCVYNDAPSDSAELIISKNRHGPIGHIDLRFIEDRMLWVDPDMRDYEDAA